MVSHTPATIGQPCHHPAADHRPFREGTQLQDLETGRLGISNTQDVVADAAPGQPQIPPDFFIHDYSRRRLKTMLPGYEKLATQQNMHGTWRQTRRFGTLFQHLSRWRQQMLTAGEAELVRLFAKRSEAAAARAASSDPSHDEGTGRDYDEEINTLADRLSGWLLNLTSDMKLRKYPRVVRTQHYDYFKYQKNEMGVPDEDLDYMRYPDDVVTLTASPIEAMIKWLMEDYDPRWSQVVPNLAKRLLNWLFGEYEDGEWFFNTELLSAYWPWGTMVVYYLMVIPPILVLYLVSLSQASIAVFVSIYFVLLSTIISLLPITEFALPLACLLAFMALLVAFLAQNQTVTMICPS